MKVIVNLQGLVDKMKEYDLDTRAGLIICRDSDLRIQYIDPVLQNILGCPTNMDELLPTSMRDRHRRLVAPYVGHRALPDSLNHPLRNVQILTKEQHVIHAKLIIGKIGNMLGSRPVIYYVIVQPCSPPHRKPVSFSGSFTALQLVGSSDRTLQQCPSSNSLLTARPAESCPSSSALQSKSDLSDSVEEGRLNSHVHDDLGNSRAASPAGGTLEDSSCLAEVYGLAAASYIDRGLVPATERYAQATVLYMDIVDFTRQCMAKPLDEISGWMARIHAAIDELLDRHAVRKVETRGDCVICVSGTNFAPTEGGASRDLCGDQATRILSFGHDLGLALSAIDGTAARMGVATGPVVLTHIAHGGGALPAKYIYGDTVNVACRMEQTGRVGALQLTEAAARTYAEEQGAPPPPLRTKEIKGKGTMRVALYDYAARRFLDDDAPVAAA
jgi:class 3 adenylate cyclase